MAFADPVLETEGLDRYYATGLEFRAPMAPPARPHAVPGAPCDVERLRGVASVLRVSVPGTSARVLDIGCGPGTLLALLRETGLRDTVGLDPSPSSVQTAREAGLDARVGSLSQLPPGLGRFDAVVLSHVLEHLPDPGSALRIARDLLHDGGVLYAEVPDASLLSAHVLIPYAEFNTEHINYFSSATLGFMAARFGFTLREAGKKIITLFQGFAYPALYGLFEAGPVAGPAPVTRDESLPAAITEYVRESERVARRLDQRLLVSIAGARDVAVRGLGNVAWTLLATTALARLSIRAYVDASPYKRGLTIGGVGVIGPDVPLPPDMPVVILSLLHERAIEEELRRSSPNRTIVKLSPLLWGDEGPGAN
jgi:SAM-dependent methyltransferase